MTNSKGRIEISENIADVLKLADKVYKKHLELGIASPLNGLVDFDWSKVGPTIEDALARHTEAEILTDKAKASYRERDLFIKDIKEILKNSRNLLKALNIKNPARLTEWGFSVSETPKKVKPTQAALQN